MEKLEKIIAHLIHYLLQVLAHFEVGAADPDGYKAWLDENYPEEEAAE